MELLPLDAQEGSDIDRSIGGFAGRAGSGLIVTSSPTALINRDLIIKLTAQHRLPAIYPFRNFATGGGLISYGPDLIDPHRRASGYVDRILKGEKPAELPVQAPTCPSRKSYPRVAMMQPRQNRRSDDGPASLDRSIVAAHPCPTINACAIHYNRRNTWSGSAADAARRR